MDADGPTKLFQKKKKCPHFDLFSYKLYIVYCICSIGDIREGDKISNKKTCVPAFRVESGMDNPPLRSALNPNFKDMDKCF